MGGLTKEWFQLLIHKIFNPDFGELVSISLFGNVQLGFLGMFVYHERSEVFWFRNSGTDHDRLREYHLIGVVRNDSNVLTIFGCF